MKKHKNVVEDQGKVAAANKTTQKRKLDEDHVQASTSNKKTHVEKTKSDDVSGENAKLFIRGLPWKASQDEVHDFFSSCGEIKSIELPLMDDGRSSGTGTYSGSTRLAVYFYGLNPTPHPYFPL